MYLDGLKLQNFKNHAFADFAFCKQVNCFTGKNGIGKTNILDAIYYLAFTKSFFNGQDQHSVKHEEPWFSIESNLIKDSISQHLRLFYQKGSKKTLFVNNNEPEKFADHIGTIPLVMILPGDIQIIHESSEERRRLFDTILSSCDKQFLFALMSYNRQLDQRNKLLKDLAEGYSVDMELLMVYNSKLVEFGTIIFNKRNEMVRELFDLFRNHYYEISSGAELAEINYQSDLSEKPFDEILIVQDLVDRLAQRTTKGVHKDDFNFILNGFPVKKFGSQGQQKSFMIALKLTFFDYLKNKTGEKPLLLLDDIFEKLDEERLSSLIKRISNQEFGQIFITDTHKKRIEDAFQFISNVEVVFHHISN
ncbi:MAG: DNA replication/repair protein RecF [Bacteroidia bacterium]